MKHLIILTILSLLSALVWTPMLIVSIVLLGIMMVINEKGGQMNSIISKDGEYLVTCYTYKGKVQVRFTAFEDAIVWAHDNKGVLSCPYCEDLDYTENNKYYYKEEEMETSRTMHERRRRLQERIRNQWLNNVPAIVVSTVFMFSVVIGACNMENMNMIVASGLTIGFVILGWLVVTMKEKTDQIEVGQNEELADVEARMKREINAKPIIISQK